MYKCVSDKDSAEWEILDLDTNESIRGVQWADDETGEYEKLVFNEDGTLRIASRRGEMVSITIACKGNIKIVRKEK